MTELADQVMVLRDEVLETVELGDPDPPGSGDRCEPFFSFLDRLGPPAG